jgi:hypothetical protein
MARYHPFEARSRLTAAVAGSLGYMFICIAKTPYNKFIIYTKPPEMDRN